MQTEQIQKGTKFGAHIQLLGGFSVSVNGVQIPEALWKSRRARSLVKLLALAPGHRLHRDQVIDTLWPDSDLPAAANNFHQTLYAARKVLEALKSASLALEEGFLTLSAGKEQSLSVDVDLFETAAARAKASQDPDRYEAALALYQGDLLPEDRYEEWTIQRREALRQVHLNLLLDLAHLLEARQEYPAAIDTLLRVLGEDRAHEEAHTHLMRLYALSGQRQQVLRQYQALRAALQAEADAEPGEKAQAVFRSIQAGKLSPPQPAERRLPTGTVTFLFTDIVGSTPLWERQTDLMAQALEIHNSALRQAFESEGGVVFKTVGDAFQAVFPTALQALRAAIAGQRYLQDAAWNDLGELKVRMGLHTGEGELDPGGDEYAVSHTKNRVARILSAAHGGQILLSAETKELVDHHLTDGMTLKDLGQHQLKGMQWPEHLYQATAPDLPDTFPSMATAARSSHNLPVQLTSFIGREDQIDEVIGLLRDHRLVTLTGSGGTGKTRLALQVAEGLLETFPDGAWLAELASLADPQGVAQAVSTALGLQRSGKNSYQAILLNYLGDKRLLLVLDNCEHLLEACAQLAHEILRGCPGVTLLATSREALGIAGETAYRVPSLSAPDPSSITEPDELARGEAVSLFAERAAAIRPGFQLTPENLPTAARICHRLDGIPLAIELAAARVGALSLEQIAAYLNDRFRLLTGGSRTALPRQRTLRASIDWSYSLLIEAEKNLLQHLSVFSGGWTLPAAQQVCALDGIQPWEILDGLASLVSKSLVAADHRPGGETRYRMLETVRQYAQERLEDAAGAARVRDAHLEYFLNMAEESEALLRSPRVKEALERLDAEVDNLRSALNWALGMEDRAGAEQAARTVCALSAFWEARGLRLEAIPWLERALPLLDEEDPARAALRARACLTIGVQCGTLRELMDKARRNAEESARLYRRLGDLRGLAQALALNYDLLYTFHFSFHNLWIPTYAPFSSENAPALKAESLSIASTLLESRITADRWAAAYIYLHIGFGDWWNRQLEDFLSSTQKAQAIFSELGDRLSEIDAISFILFSMTFDQFMSFDQLDNTETSISRQEPDYTLIEHVLSMVHDLDLKIPQTLLSRTLGAIAFSQERYAEMVDYFEENRRLAPLYGDMFDLIFANRMSGVGLLHLGKISEALRRLKETLELARQHNDPSGVLSVFIHMAGLAAAAQEPQKAALLLGFAESQYEDFFKPVDWWDKPLLDQYTSQVKAALEESQFNTLWQAGRDMSMEQALDAARKISV